MQHVVVYGPPACGKTRNKKALARHFKCRDVVDGIASAELPRKPQTTKKTLFLTTEKPEGFSGRYFRAVSFEDAMREARL